MNARASGGQGNEIFMSLVLDEVKIHESDRFPPSPHFKIPLFVGVFLLYKKMGSYRYTCSERKGSATPETEVAKRLV